MNVNLTPQLESLIKEKVATGLYNNASEVVREALRLMELRDRLELVRGEAGKGLSQLQQGKKSEAKPVTQQILRSDNIIYAK